MYPLTELAIGDKVRKMNCNYKLEATFKGLNKIPSAEALLNYPYPRQVLHQPD